MNPTAPTPPADNHRRTPDHILRAARECLGTIQLDPASDVDANKAVQAVEFYNQRGLYRPWIAETVWLNPPGGLVDEQLNQLPPKQRPKGCMSSAAVWWQKLQREYLGKRVKEALFLSFNLEVMLNAQNVGDGVPPQSYPFCVPDSRVKYPSSAGGNSGSPPGASAIFYLGPDHAKFVKCFREIGWCT
jgi:hypothetical protein